MNVVLINGSLRKQGATGRMLEALARLLEAESGVQTSLIQLANLKLQHCLGCGSCFRTGHCVLPDGGDALSAQIVAADALVLGSPTYESNVSGTMKTLMDRGHFVMEQLLHQKPVAALVSYENFGGRKAAGILRSFLAVSGGKVSDVLVHKCPQDGLSLEAPALTRQLKRLGDALHRDIQHGGRHPLQQLKHFFVYRMGIRPTVLKKGQSYAGVRQHWQERGL